MSARIVIAEWLWDGAWLPDGALYVDEGVARPATATELAAGPIERVTGSVLPPLTDFHVHLDLVDAASVATGGLARVLDLDADPTHAHDWRAGGVGSLEVAVAGPIHTAPGGYPTTRPWASDAMSVEIPDAVAGTAAIADAVALGADVIKIALNSDVGPVWDDELLAAMVRAAHDAGKAVVAHAEGAGQAERAFVAGADALAHTPFTEHLDDGLLARMARSMSFISTLRIHTGRDRERALNNLARFAWLGGRILYGTDMGNGPSSGGIERDELELLAAAGATPNAVLTAMTSDALLPRWSGSASHVPLPPPGAETDLWGWLGAARYLAPLDT